MPMGRISSLVRETLDFAGGNRSVRCEPCHQMDAHRMANSVGYKCLLARTDNPDTSAADLCTAPCAERLIQGVLLVAEAAADVRLDNSDVAPRSAECLTDDAANDVVYLRGRDHSHAAIFLVGEAAVIFNMAVLDSRSVIPALNFDETRLLNRFFIITLRHGRVLQDVVREFFVELRRIRLHGLLHVKNERQLLILYFQRADTLGRRHLILRNYDGYVIAPVADMLVEQMPVSHVLMRRVH